ncbi:helix-turn-helix transcriptional regulator [Paucibacter sp. R3-3]|uniref:Helix-turn-helix transcriptional regulator n=1 Tax=Roseateles agri TaxID=3098619 RepID=A0ABU5DPE0_9BURK|nr:helix-turn-helix transcriptional regulator [Paucibacter sp. R3-3]MDY0748176.1 helix-turn-helix transcriptional regulator [Paucibacter sp. R3-3]
MQAQDRRSTAPPIPSAAYVTRTVAQTYLLVAERHGMGEAEFLDRSGTCRADMEGWNGRVAGAAHRRTLRLFDAMGIVPLPQADGGFDDLHAFYPALMTLLASSGTLREALRNYVQYLPQAMGNFDRLSMREDDERVQLTVEQTDSAGLSSAPAFGVLMLARNIARHYEARASTLIRVEVLGRLPGAGAALKSAADCHILDDAPRNTCLISGAVLDQPFEFYNPHVQRYARQQLDRQFEELQASFSLSAQVRLQLRHCLRAPTEASQEENLLALMCERLGMSRWTLRRRLAFEGASFAALLAAQRRDELCRLLAQTELSIAEIGDQLGLSTPASVARFARRQLGVTASEYRFRVRTMGM